jgi:hypothetical protein
MEVYGIYRDCLDRYELRVKISAYSSSFMEVLSLSSKDMFRRMEARLLIAAGVALKAALAAI